MLWYLLQFGVVATLVWMLLGPPVFRLWIFVEFTIASYPRFANEERFGYYQGRAAASKARRAEGAADLSDALTAKISEQAAEIAGSLGWSTRPHVALVDSLPLYENAVFTKNIGDEHFVLVSRKLAAELGPDVIRGVLAHELGHALRLNRALHRTAFWIDLWSSVICLAMAWGLSDSLWGVVAWFPVRSAAHMLSLAIRRTCEDRADRFTVTAGCGEGQLRFLEWRRASRRLPQPPELLSTHPSYEHRIASRAESSRQHNCSHPSSRPARVERCVEGMLGRS